HARYLRAGVAGGRGSGRSRLPRRRHRPRRLPQGRSRRPHDARDGADFHGPVGPGAEARGHLRRPGTWVRGRVSAARRGGRPVITREDIERMWARVLATPPVIRMLRGDGVLVEIMPDGEMRFIRPGDEETTSRDTT